MAVTVSMFDPAFFVRAVRKGLKFMTFYLLCGDAATPNKDKRVASSKGPDRKFCHDFRDLEKAFWRARSGALEDVLKRGGL